jgi:hypothetical protein
MYVGVQFTGAVAPGTTHRWFTWGWPQQWDTVWTVVPTTPAVGAPQIEWNVAVERASNSAVTYWISIRNLTSRAVNIEARYAIMDI